MLFYDVKPILKFLYYPVNDITFIRSKTMKVEIAHLLKIIDHAKLVFYQFMKISNIKKYFKIPGLRISN